MYASLQIPSNLLRSSENKVIFNHAKFGVLFSCSEFCLAIIDKIYVKFLLAAWSVHVAVHAKFILL